MTTATLESSFADQALWLLAKMGGHSAFELSSSLGLPLKTVCAEMHRLEDAGRVQWAAKLGKWILVPGRAARCGGLCHATGGTGTGGDHATGLHHVGYPVGSRLLPLCVPPSCGREPAVRLRRVAAAPQAAGPPALNL